MAPKEARLISGGDFTPMYCTDSTAGYEPPVKCNTKRKKYFIKNK